MKVFVTGVTGQLGFDVFNELNRRGIDCTGSGRAQIFRDIRESAPAIPIQYVSLDITDAQAVRKTLLRIKPDVVIHCAAWTAVDLAEDQDNYKDVYAINVEGTKNIAKACQALNSKMVYISTDYVFNGQGDKPWEPDSHDYGPLNVYGQSKLEGELVVANLLEKYFIVRIAWVFGLNGSNFVKTMLSIGRKYESIKVVNDQIGTPTYTADLARLLVDMMQTDKYGYYHATNEGGFISWYDFAQEIFRQANYDTRVVPVSTTEYGASKTKRPFNSRLSKDKLREAGFELLPSWQNALRRYLRDLQILG